MLNCRFLGGQQLHLQRVHDGFGNFVLNGEDVSKITVVAIGPNMSAALAVDQLGTDSNPGSRFSDATLKNVGTSEPLGDIGHIYRLVFELEGSVPCDHL